MSSIHANATELVEHTGENSITKPSMIIDYNKYMNEVDKCGQYLIYYSLERKGMKLWRVFFRLFEF